MESNLFRACRVYRAVSSSRSPLRPRRVRQPAPMRGVRMQGRLHALQSNRSRNHVSALDVLSRTTVLRSRGMLQVLPR